MKREVEKLETKHGTFTENTLTGQTAEEVYQEWLENKDKEPDKTKICKSAEELTKENEQLWETVEYLLKQVNMIPKGDVSNE